MSTEAATTTGVTPFEQLRLGRDILRTEAHALLALADRLGEDFCQAVDFLACRSGSTIVCGMGKAGLVGQKLAATLASTGTRSHFLHPADAVHGDLGRLHSADCLLMLSYSGETEEIVRILPAVAEMKVPIIAITGNVESQLARSAHIVLSLGPVQEACPLGLAPTTSTTAMIALGDALALVLSRMRRFGREDFARFHPGGSLGRKLAKVEELMRPLTECRVGQQESAVREVLVQLSRPGRRTGAIMVIDQRGVLVGIFTDSDLARLLEGKRDEALDGPVKDVMTPSPKSIRVGAMLEEALQLMASGKLSELPVVDAAGHAMGLIDITDVLGLPMRATEPSNSLKPAKSPAASPHTISFPNPGQGSMRR